MPVKTSLVDFAEFPRIKAFFESNDSVLDTSCLFIVLDDRVISSLEVIRGTLEQGIDLILESAIENEISNFGGYFQKLSEDFPDDIPVKFTVEGTEFNHYHMFKFGSNKISAHLTVLGTWYESDLEILRSFLNALNFSPNENMDPCDIGDILKHEDFTDSVSDKVGKRTYLGNLTIEIH